MKRVRWPLWLFLAVACVALLGPWTSDADGQGRPQTLVAIGALGSSAQGERVESQLHEALRDQLQSVRGVREAPRGRARYVIQGSVTRLERRKAEHETEVECEVSLMLSERRGGSVRALLAGRAGARGGGPTERLEQAALVGAVRGALRRLPTAIGSASHSR